MYFAKPPERNDCCQEVQKVMYSLQLHVSKHVTKISMPTQYSISLYGAFFPVPSLHMQEHFHFEMELIHELLKYQLWSSCLHKILFTDLKALLDDKSPLLVPRLFFYSELFLILCSHGIF